MHKKIKNCIVLFILIIATALSANTTPKFSLIPSTITKMILPVNGNFTVQYKVTNNTKITRTLTMTPIQGITQNTSGDGVCANPFTLTHNQSCTLILDIDGSKIPSLINKGPVICKTNSTGNTPDPFLCSQPSFENSLSIERGRRTDAIISASPTILEMLVDTTNNIITVTNESLFVTAEDINMPLPTAWTDVSETSNCSSLAPLAQCTFNLTTGPTSYTETINALGGNNTNELKISLSVVQVPISINPSTIEIPANDSFGVTVTVTNNSSAFTALNVDATSPWSDVTLTKTGCASIAPLGTCTMKFVSTSSSAHGQQSIKIKGTDTTSVILVASVSNTDTATITISPKFTLLAENFPQPIVITNTSDSGITATNVHVVPSSSDVAFSPQSCGTLAPQQSCTITLTAQVINSVVESFEVTGTQATTETGSFKIITYGDSFQDGYVFALGVFGAIPLTGSVAATADLGGIYEWAVSAPSYPCGNDLYNGAQNTSQICTAYDGPNGCNGPLVSNAPAAAGCVHYSSTNYDDWYLPAVCQFYSLGGCSASPQNNMYSNLFNSQPPNIGNFSSNDRYWTSYIEGVSTGACNVHWYIFDQNNTDASPVSTHYPVRCARNFLPNTP